MARSSPLTIRRVCALLLLLLAPLLAAFHQPGSAQSPGLPGVRGWFYESPTYGWSMIIDPAIWTVDSATSEAGVDTVSLTAWDGNTEVVALLVEIYSPEPKDGEACLIERENRMLEAWPTATITRARDASGEIVDRLQTHREWRSAYIVVGAPGLPDAVVEISCIVEHWRVETRGVVAAIALMPTDTYSQGADYLEDLADTIRPAGQNRTAEAQPDGLPPRIGVLEFFGVPECGDPPSVISRPPGGREGFRSFEGAYPTPTEPLAPNQAYVMHAGLVGNVDNMPSLVDLTRLVAVPADRAGGPGSTPAAPTYLPTHYIWIWGVSPGMPPTAILEPGQSALYLIWFVVDQPAPEASLSFDVQYEPVVGFPTYAGYTTWTDDEAHHLFVNCGGADGSRPRIRVGD